MTNIQIITLLFTSSFLGAIVTSFINWVIQGKNYKNEYYKKLLDNRIKAYEMIIFYTDQMKLLVDLGNGNVCHRFLASGQEVYSSFFIAVAAGTEKAFWLSPETSHLITTFNMFLHEEVSNKINNSENTDLKLIELGIQHKETISNLRIKIEKQMQNDLKDLHRIEKFVNNIGHEYKYLIQSPVSHKQMQ